MKKLILSLIATVSLSTSAQQIYLRGEQVYSSGECIGRIVDVCINYPAMSNSVIALANAIDATNYANAYEAWQVQTNAYPTNYAIAFQQWQASTNAYAAQLEEWNASGSTSNAPVEPAPFVATPFPEFVAPEKLRKVRVDYN